MVGSVSCSVMMQVCDEARDAEMVHSVHVLRQNTEVFRFHLMSKERWMGIRMTGAEGDGVSRKICFRWLGKQIPPLRYGMTKRGLRMTKRGCGMTNVVLRMATW